MDVECLHSEMAGAQTLAYENSPWVLATSVFREALHWSEALNVPLLYFPVYQLLFG